MVKVLLRERKRHTARRVTSAYCAVLFGGISPCPDLGPNLHMGWYSNLHPELAPDLDGGVLLVTPPPSWPGTWPGWGGTLKYCPNLRWGYPPQVLTWDESTPPPPDLGWGILHPNLGWGTSPPPSAGWGTPPQNVNRQTLVKTVPSPFLRNAGGKNWVIVNILFRLRWDFVFRKWRYLFLVGVMERQTVINLKNWSA